MDENDVENLYNKIYDEKSLFRKYQKHGLSVFKKKKQYIHHYQKMKLSTLLLTGGNSEKSFIM